MSKNSLVFIRKMPKTKKDLQKLSKIFQKASQGSHLISKTIIKSLGFTYTALITNINFILPMSVYYKVTANIIEDAEDDRQKELKVLNDYDPPNAHFLKVASNILIKQNLKSNTNCGIFQDTKERKTWIKELLSFVNEITMAEYKQNHKSRFVKEPLMNSDTKCTSTENSDPNDYNEEKST